MTLEQLQAGFASALRGSGERRSLMQQIVSTEGFPAEERFSVYRDGASAALICALGEIYPVCRRLVGPQFFDAMAARFVRRTHSVSPDLGDYGAALAEFISGFEPARGLAYLADEARLEWAWHSAFNGPNVGTLDVAALAARSAAGEEDIVFELPANCTLLGSDYPIQKIWRVNQPEYPGDSRVDLASGCARLMIWRPAEEVEVVDLSSQHWALLSAIREQQTVGRICESLAELDIPSHLSEFTRRGWLAGFH